LSFGFDLKSQTFILYVGFRKAAFPFPFKSLPNSDNTLFTDPNLYFAANSLAHDVFRMNSRELANFG